MFRFVSIFFVAAIGAAGYFFYNTGFTLSGDPQTPDGAEQQVNSQDSEQINSTNSEQPQPAKVSIETEPAPVALPTLTKEQKTQAKAHVQSITSEPEKPIEIKSADHFVTAEQVLELPELQAEIIKIETVNDASTASAKQVDVIVSAPKKDNEQVTIEQSNQNNAQAAQSFAVKIPSFNKTKSSEPEPKSKTTAPASSETKADTQKLAINTSTQKTAEPIKSLEVAQSPVKVLTTVTGTTAQPAEVIAVKVNPVKVTPVIIKANIVKAKTNIEQDSDDTATIIGALKKNLEEISDIKVSDLADLVTDIPTPKSVTEPTPKLNTNKSEKAVIKAVTNADQSTSSTQTLSQTTSTVSIPATKKVATSQSETNRIKLKELLNDTDSDKKRIFYLHAVNPTDEQGIWGIIQKGLTGTFSKGISLRQANGTVRTLIPEDADEMLSNKNSSFLGKLLNYKVLTTYVYNYEKGNIGKNPDYIKPGQQLIIVTFTEQELMSVYQHFKNEQN